MTYLTYNVQIRAWKNYRSLLQKSSIKEYLYVFVHSICTSTLDLGGRISHIMYKYLCGKNYRSLLQKSPVKEYLYIFAHSHFFRMTYLTYDVQIHVCKKYRSLLQKSPIKDYLYIFAHSHGI